MKHFTFAAAFRALYDKAVASYARGQRGAASFFSPAEIAFLAANGISAQHLYDYAEDFTQEGLPDFGTAIGIELVRRDYFLNVQLSRPSAAVLDSTGLPRWDATLRGISWLPRLLPKARAKLRGELAPSLMYSCGGDRAFFEAHDIHPAEFLSVIWRTPDDDSVAAWVAARSAAK
jgi:hypothetical protein